MNPGVIPYDLGCEPSSGVTGEVVIASADNVYLIFEEDFSDSIALIECIGCASFKMGYPNDEGINEHPMYQYGMKDVRTGVMEVLHSQWLDELRLEVKLSAKRIRGNESANLPLEESKHFIIALKENTYECIATSLKLVNNFASFNEASNHAISNLGDVAGS